MEPNPERNLYQVLSNRADWSDVSKILHTVSGALEIDDGRLQGILELVPDTFSLRVGKAFYAIAFGGGVTKDYQREALAREKGMIPSLTAPDIAHILNRACWRAEPEDLG